MSDQKQFTSVAFKNYKALKNYSISLKHFNVLVGPNNAGKSTIIGAFRILAEGMRKASARNAEYIPIDGFQGWGYRVSLDDLPIATENIFSDYDESNPASIEFRLTGGNKLELIFPEQNACYLRCKTSGKLVQTPAAFRKEFNATIGFVPVLGPVEHDERLFQKDAARLALLTHRASRNFRNIWYHYPEDFDEFRSLIRSTWPGMDIERPEVHHNQDRTILYMFCPEDRFPREIYWAGFGFQVWCQMLTYIVRSKKDTLLIIDEPDIYLHSDLQRQLVGFLRDFGPDILIATHSTEIISEADPGDLLVVNKKAKSAKRIKNPAQLQDIFSVLGSNLNPTLTQLAKTKRVIFVEGKDFQIFSAFARKLGRNEVANRADFAVVSIGGFNPQKVSDFSKGIEMTLGAKLLKAVIFDRDYRSDDEVAHVRSELKKHSELAHIHQRKELENYVLDPSVIDRALAKRINEYNSRTDNNIKCDEKTEDILMRLTDGLRNKISGQFLSKRMEYERSKQPGLDNATINQRLLEEFDGVWSNLSSRIKVIPGKIVLSDLNNYLQEKYVVTLSPGAIISEMTPEEVCPEIRDLIEQLNDFRVLGVNDMGT